MIKVQIYIDGLNHLKCGIKKYDTPCNGTAKIAWLPYVEFWFRLGMGREAC